MSAAASAAALAGLSSGTRHRSALRLRALAPVVAGVLALAVGAWAIRPYPVGIFHDDGVYLILAKALATGQGYHYLHLPGAPAATHYPPGYPLLLAAIWWFAPNFPSNLPAFLVLQAVLLGAAAWGICRFAERRLAWSPVAATALALCATLSLPLLLLAAHLMSEVLFVALLFPFLGAAERVLADADDASTSSDRRVALVGFAGGALALVRMHAVVAAAALFLLLVMRKRWRAASVCAAAFVVALAPWQLWMMLHNGALATDLRGSYGSYLGWLVRGFDDQTAGGLFLFARTMALNLGAAGGLLGDRLSLWPPGWPRIITVAVAVLLMGLGAARVWRRAPVTVAFTGLYVLITLAWPFAPWRFLWTVWPLALLFLAEGGIYALERCERLGGRYASLASLAPLGLIAVGIARAEVETYRESAWTVPARVASTNIAPVIRWVSRNTSPSDVIVCDAEPLLFLFTGRRAVPPASFTATEYVAPRKPGVAEETLGRLLTKSGARYVVTVMPETRDAARKLANASRDGGQLLRELPPSEGAAVFERVNR